jgi:hypothetical protein
MKQRTPMKRTAMLRRAPVASSSAPVAPREPKERKCSAPNCEATFVPRRMEHVVCSPRCLIAKRKADEKAERESTKARKQAIKTIPDLIREAQVAFNAFIRARDDGRPCICCGRMADDRDLITGSRWDAGHTTGRRGVRRTCASTRTTCTGNWCIATGTAPAGRWTTESA